MLILDIQNVGKSPRWWPKNFEKVNQFNELD